jgi:preprotein translocase subunit YajC
VDLLIFVLFMLAVFWLLVIVPQRRRTSQHNAMIQGVKPGDYIVTAGGLYGTVTELGDDDLGLEIAPDVEVRVARRSIGAVIPPEEIEDVEVGDELEGDAVAQETDAADLEREPARDERG